MYSFGKEYQKCFLFFRQEQESMSSTPKRSRGGTSDVTATKKKNDALRHSPVKSHIPGATSHYPEPPETVCPICGGVCVCVGLSCDFNN